MTRITSQHEQLLEELHSQGLTNRELGRKLAISEPSVKRIKQKLGLGSNCPRNLLGAWGEEAFRNAAALRGLHAQVVSQDGHVFDVDVEGLRVEVKTAGFHGGQWRFRLPAVRPSFHSEAPPTFKDYVQDCDLLALVGKGRATGEPPFFHFRLPRPDLSNVTLRSAALVPGVRDNWGVLEDLLERKAA